MKQTVTVLGAAVALAMAMPTGADAQAERNLRFGIQHSVGSPMYEGVERFKETVERLSDGALTIEVFPASQLGDFRQMGQQLTTGDLDLSLMAFGDISEFVPRASIAETPYVVHDFGHALRIVDSDWGRGVQQEMRQAIGWHLVDTWYFGTRQLTSNRPVETFDDMAGLKLRVPGARVLVEWSEAMGAATTPIAFQEVYLALQTGTAEAQENPLPTIESMRFYEVQDHISLTNHSVVVQNVVVSTITWNELSILEREILQAAATEGGVVATGRVMRGEADLLAFFEQEGLTVHRPDLAPFRAAMEPVYARNAEVWGDGVLEQIQALSEE